jgi:hypothetical protein
MVKAFLLVASLVLVPSLTSTAAIRAAAKTKPALFSIFPRHVGKVACQIPRKGSTPIPGSCSTRVATGPGYSGQITVTFRETWNGGRRQHTWRVLESPAGRPLAVRSSGARPPQLG